MHVNIREVVKLDTVHNGHLEVLDTATQVHASYMIHRKTGIIIFKIT